MSGVRIFLRLNIRTLRDRFGTKWVNLDDLLHGLRDFERDLKDGGDPYKGQASSVRTIRELLENER